MTFYPAASHPHRASTGSMPLYVSTSYHHDPNHEKKYEEKCDSCGTSYTDENLLRINTPYSSTSSLHPVDTGHRSRRSSNAEPPKVLTRYPNGALVLEPAVSYTYQPRRGPSGSSASPAEGAASVPRTSQYHHRRYHDERRKSFTTYSSEIDTTTVRGTTKIPRKLVNKDAVRQMGYDFEEDRANDTIIVQRALGKEEVEQLVKLTAQFRANRQSSSTSSKESNKHVRIVTHPVETHERVESSPPVTVIAGSRQYYHGLGRHSSSGSAAYTTSPPHTAPLSMPMPNSAFLEPGSVSRHSTYRHEREGRHRRSASTSSATTTIRVGSDGRSEVVVRR